MFRIIKGIHEMHQSASSLLFKANMHGLFNGLYAYACNVLNVESWELNNFERFAFNLFSHLLKSFHSTAMSHNISCSCVLKHLEFYNTHTHTDKN